MRTIFASSRIATWSPGLPACDPDPLPDPEPVPLPAALRRAGALPPGCRGCGRGRRGTVAAKGADADDPHATTTAPTAVRTRRRVASRCGRRREVGLRIARSSKCPPVRAAAQAPGRHTAGGGSAAYTRPMHLPFDPPLEPMLAKASDGLPDGEGWLFEPKWDGFRAIVFRDGDEVLIQSRDLKPLDRYFPELAEPIRAVVSGALRRRRRGRHRRSTGSSQFESLLLRIHPAASRVKMLAAETPASFVGWDLLALDDEDLRETPQGERRARLEAAFASVEPPIHLTPATRDRALAADWFDRFEGAGLDGVVAKQLDAPYQPGKRAMLKIKHQRTADCVVAGFRWHKNGPGHPRRVAAARPVRRRRQAPSRRDHVVIHLGAAARRSSRSSSRCARARLDGHPWQRMGGMGVEGEADASGQRLPGATAAGTAARTCRGSRSGPSGSPRSPTTTSRAIASGTRRRSSAGGRTSRPRAAATTSSRRQPPTRSRRSSAADDRGADVAGGGVVRDPRP